MTAAERRHDPDLTHPPAIGPDGAASGPQPRAHAGPSVARSAWLSPRAKGVAVWALRLILGGLFTLAGVLKLADPRAFALEIHNYQLFPALAPLLAAALPAAEVAVGVAVLAAPRPWLRAGALASAALMVLFTFAVSSAVARGINISCGCFGAGASPVTLITVLRDLALLAASAALLHLTGDERRPRRRERRPPAPPRVAVGT